MPGVVIGGGDVGSFAHVIVGELCAWLGQGEAEEWPGGGEGGGEVAGWEGDGGLRQHHGGGESCCQEQVQLGVKDFGEHHSFMSL